VDPRDSHFFNSNALNPH